MIIDGITDSTGTGLKDGLIEAADFQLGLNDAVGFHADNGPQQGGTAIYTVSFGSSRFDSHGGWNGSTRYVCKESGIYLINYGWMLNANTPNRHVLAKNGVATFTNQYIDGSRYDRIAWSGLLSLVVDDYIEVFNDISSQSEGNKHQGYDYFNATKVGV